MDSIDWLLDADPAIRWQALRDLTDASLKTVAEERARVTRQGLGAEILARQKLDGSWRRGDSPLWSATLYTLLLLRSTGVDAAEPAVESSIARLEKTLRWSNNPFWELREAEFGGNPFFDGEEEPCINGGVLALSAYFGRPSRSLARRLLGEQLEDGGWNCEAPKSVRSSFHTTLCVLEGLLAYEQSVGPAPAIATARRRAEEYLLERALYRRRSTGETASPAFLELAFPSRYHYDILRALDYFREAYPEADPRLSEAIHLLASKQQSGNHWLLDRAYDEVLSVPVGESVGEPSRWNTLRALRVLRWYNQQRS